MPSVLSESGSGRDWEIIEEGAVGNDGDFFWWNGELGDESCLDVAGSGR